MIYGLPAIGREIDGARFGIRVCVPELREQVEVRVMGCRITATVERATSGRQVSERVHDILVSGRRLGPMGMRRLMDSVYVALLDQIDELYPAVVMH